MKSTLLSIALVLGVYSIGSSQISFGGGINYLSDIGISVRAKTDVGKFDIIPKFSYFFTKGATTTAFDLDASLDIISIGEGNPINLFAGPALYRVSANGDGTSRLGINLGAGLQISHFYGEVRYTGLFCESCGGDVGIAAGYYF